VISAAHLFDQAVDEADTMRFLNEPGHHLLLAYQDGLPVGMVTGVEMTHPDKGTEMLVYELGVSEGLRGRGIGRALVLALADVARERGCYGMWTLTDPGNSAAISAYRAAGGTADGVEVTLTWSFEPGKTARDDQ
jgi:ribosomal protein S18 acetylase RimI-like enzyme